MLTCPGWRVSLPSIQWRDFIWRRPRDVVLDDEDKPQLFSHAVSSNDIHQGALADCYILSAMSALAEDPKAVQRLFPPDRQRPELGLYTVRLCVRGHWRNVLVDDQLPCFSHREGAELVFSKGGGNDLWVPLVEKALAKEAGSFQALESNESYSGQAGETLSTFTGAPCEYIASSEDRIFDNIHAATCRAPGFTNNGWFVVAVLPDGAGDMHAEDLGLVVRHSYAVLDAREVTLAAAPGEEEGGPRTERILQLRNPWGEAKWSGSYAPGSPDWTPEVLQQLAGDTGQHALEGVHTAENGVFWLSLADFTHYFAGVQICRASKDMSDSSDDVHIAPGATAVLALTIKGDSPVVVDLSALQHDTHMLAVKHHAFCQLVGLRMQVVDVKTHSLVGATQLLQQRDLWLGIPALAPGKYWVLVETDWDGTARPDADDAKGGIKIAVSVRSTAPEVDILAVPPVSDAVMGVDGKVIKRAMLHAMCLASPAQDMGQVFPTAPPRKLAANITKRMYTGEDTVAWLYENDSRSLVLTERLPFELHNMAFVEGHTSTGRREPDLVTVSVRPVRSCPAHWISLTTPDPRRARSLRRASLASLLCSRPGPATSGGTSSGRRMSPRRRGTTRRPHRTRRHAWRTCERVQAATPRL